MKNAILVIAAVLIFQMSYVQTDVHGSEASSQAAIGYSVTRTNQITFDQFLNEVATANLDYAAQRYNVSIAEAGIAAAREFPNPVLQVNGSSDITHSGSEKLPSTVGASLVQTLELGGKRKYRILAARRSFAATASTLEDFLRNLKLDAASAFADALSSSRRAEQKRASARDLAHLAETQRQRRRLGDISEADMLQAQVEERQFQNELLTAEAEADRASLALCTFLGQENASVRLIAKGELDVQPRAYDVPLLIRDALQHRPDLLALRHTRDALQAKTFEEKANRIPNLDLGPSWTHNSSSQNSIAPSPEFDSLGLSVSLPIPLWNRNRAAIASARFTAEQAQKQLEAAELKAEVQIRQSADAYRSAAERVRNYQGGILKDAQAVLAAKRFSYQQGQSSLLELLDAQRTDNEVQSSYTDALADQARALIELERAANFWQLRF